MADVFAKLAAVNPWINGRLAFIIRHGSHAYGTNIATSDEDFKGACIAPKACYLGFKSRFEQQELKDPDTCVYEVRKFFDLASECNPNIIEVLHVDPKDHVLITAAGEKIFNARDKFLSKSIRYTFAGYARDQLGRIEGHYRWLKDPPKAPPVRSDFKLPEKMEIAKDQFQAAQAEIAKEIARYHLNHLDDMREDQKIAVRNEMKDILAELHITKNEEWQAASRKIGLNDNFIAIMQREREYEGKVREWKQYNKWKEERNEVRAQLEAKYGYDTKHAYHLVRLIRMCREILETGRVIVKRPDFEELLYIRNGGWSYEKLIEWARSEEGQLDAVCAKSKIPVKPDMDFLDKLCAEVVEMIL